MTDDPRRGAVAFLNDERVGAEVARALPAHVPVDWFLRCAQTAILNNPRLAEANKPSLLRELVAVAQLGLVTDPQLGEAWLIIDRQGQVQRRVGYQGLRKLALQSGMVTALNAQAVYENDQTDIDLGDSPHVHHKIDVKQPDRGKLLGCYAVARIAGTDMPQVEWMAWKQIEEHRDRYSDAYRHPDPKKRGPWSDKLAEVEMARKTVFRRLAKWLPKSPLLADALAHEDRMDMRDVTPEARELPAPEDPMDRVVAEQRANGDASGGAAEAQGRTPPPQPASTPPIASAPPLEAQAGAEPAKRRGRRSYGEIARDIIDEIMTTPPDMVGNLLHEHKAMIAKLPEELRTEVIAAANERMGIGDLTDSDDQSLSDPDDVEPESEIDDRNDAERYVDAMAKQIASFPAMGHLRAYGPRMIDGAETHGAEVVAVVKRLLAEREQQLTRQQP